MRTFIALAVALLMGWATVRYLKKIKTRDAKPSLVTWMLFLVGILVSFLTFQTTPNASIVSNITNTVDLLMATAVLGVLTRYGGKEQWRFEWVDLGCLVGAVAILGYWLGHREAFLSAHLTIQAIFIIAYVPMVRKLWRADRNIEDFVFWSMACLASALGTVLAITDEKLMPAVYAGRSTTFTALALILMLRLERKQRKKGTQQ